MVWYYLYILDATHQTKNINNDDINDAEHYSRDVVEQNTSPPGISFHSMLSTKRHNRIQLYHADARKQNFIHRY